MGCFFGLNLPKVAEVLFNQGKNWDIPKGQALTGEWEPGSGGRHEIYCSAYGGGWFTADSWGVPVYLSDAFVSAYLEEAQGAFSRSMQRVTGVAPNNLDWKHLDACMNAMRAANAGLAVT
jgi:hypothetical protein